MILKLQVVPENKLVYCIMIKNSGPCHSVRKMGRKRSGSGGSSGGNASVVVIDQLTLQYFSQL